MTDQYTLCQNAFVVQLQTLSDKYFPAATGRNIGWQVSEDDTMPLEGGDYFVILRPGRFETVSRGGHEENQWHILAALYMRYSEQATLWTNYRTFRGDILSLKNTAPLKGSHIIGQDIIAQNDPGFIVDSKTGNYLSLVSQILDVTIRQRVVVARQY